MSDVTAWSHQAECYPRLIFIVTASCKEPPHFFPFMFLLLSRVRLVRDEADPVAPEHHAQDVLGTDQEGQN